jgi:hypothetical protein
MTLTLRRLGTGWAFPLRPDATRGNLGYRSGAEKVREAILLILQTEPGERVMRPTFGAGLPATWPSRTPSPPGPGSRVR